ncbi:MAG TPA: LysM peptidoglycan-binding domain-containing protein [Gemmatimonadales bacterium]|nr:LysM peptidoglycan-binding domain-containing protein [Gemmatimonadales bacterium]
MRFRWPVFTGILLACAPSARGPVSSPNPAPPRADSALAEGEPNRAAAETVAVAREAARVPAAPAPAARRSEAAGSDTAAVDVEAAADLAVLEQLDTVHPASTDTGDDAGADAALPGGANEAKTPASWDIDVTTYGSHSRVQFYLDFFQGPARDRFTIWLQRMPRYEPMIREKLRQYGLPEDMVYLALIESGFSNSAVSRSRAVGMWQFMKGTGKLYGLRVDSWVDERRDPIRATDAAARHLADLRDQFGSLYLAAAAYNAGAGRVNRGLRRMNRSGAEDEDEDENPDASFFRLYDTRYIRRETKDYVPKLIAAALIAKEPERYGFPPAEPAKPLPMDSIVVTEATGLDVLARLADTTVAAMRELNPHLLRAVTPPRSRAVVRLPAGTAERVAARYAQLAPQERVTTVEHVVARGQTLGSIARLYGVSSRVIANANPGVRAGRLRPGTRLTIPTSYAMLSTLDRRSVEDRPRRSSGVVGAGRHRVRAGESLWIVSQRYRVSVSELRRWNGIEPGEVLKAGEVIWVSDPAGAAAASPSAVASAPSGGSRVHVVRSGDTLSGIAARYGVTVSALRSANGLDRYDVLKAGTTLRIP